MKIFKSVILIVTAFLAFHSCQKELIFSSNGDSTGVFKKDGSGNCLPVVVTGVFKVDSVLTNSFFVDIQVNVSTPGTFDIKSDTVNGYSFHKTGTVVFGINTIRLYPSGKPITAGTNTFTVKYGTSTCSFDIKVSGPGAAAATFTLGGSPGLCTGATAGGVYTVNTALTPANTLTVQVNVTNPGTYVIGAVASSGFVFTGSGVFTSGGLQNVTLTGTGTPTTAGIIPVTVTNLASTCTFAVPVLPAGGGTAAVYTLDGASGNCTNFVVNGTYAVNTAMSMSNTVKLNVSVTAPGTYTINTNTANGISFSKTGLFTATGPQVVTLTATGTPVSQGPFSFSPSTGSGGSTCNFIVTFVPAVPIPSGDYFPLTANSWWSYDYADFGVPQPDTLYMNAMTTKVYGGNTYRELGEEDAGLPTDTLHYRKSGNDYYQWVPTDMYSAIFAFDNTTYAEINILKENAATGTTWSSAEYTGTVSGIPAKVKYDFKIESANTSITIGTVTYSNVIQLNITMQVSAAGFPYTTIQNSNYYYAKGIGPINIIHTQPGGMPIGERKIRNYKIF